jgi:hypothetical protein
VQDFQVRAQHHARLAGSGMPARRWRTRLVGAGGDACVHWPPRGPAAGQGQRLDLLVVCAAAGG